MDSKTILIGFAAGIVILVALVVWSQGSQLYVWNSLRPFESISDSLDTITTIIVLLLSVGLFYIATRAYDKAHTQQFFLLSLAFGIFALKFLIETLDIFYSPGNFFSPAAKNVFDFFVLIALFASLIKK